MRNLLPALIVLAILRIPHAAWQEVPMPAGMSKFGTVVVGPGGNVYSFRHGTVWHSAERGATFQKSALSVEFDGEAVDTSSWTWLPLSLPMPP